VAKIVKSISLDETTAPLAAAKDNFSAWVREQLYHEIIIERDCAFFTRTKTERYWSEDLGAMQDRIINETEICNGMRKPRCPKCYPEGSPTSENWLAYAKWEIDRTELLARTNERYTAIERAKNPENGLPTPHLRPQKKYVRRLLAWIWSYI